MAKENFGEVGLMLECHFSGQGQYLHIVASVFGEVELMVF